MLRETSVQHGDFLLIFDPATVAFFEKHVHIVSRLTMARGQILSAHDWPFPQRQLLAQSGQSAPAGRQKALDTNLILLSVTFAHHPSPRDFVRVPEL